MKIFYKFLLFSILSILLFSCGKVADDKFDDAILEANFLLSDRKCSEAIAVLEKVGSASSTNSLFLQVYASAYACAAGYSDLDFFSEASTKLTSGATDFLNSLATFDYSAAESTVESSAFQNMLEGIEVLTAGGGNTNANHTGREAIFGESGTQSLNLQALFMTVQAIGQYVHFYGDADATTGVKTRCLYTYTTAVAQAAVGAGPVTSCSAGSGYVGGNAGTGADAIRRACQGIVLYNQMIDLLLNTALTNADDYGDLDLVYANIETAYNTFCGQNASTQAMCDLKTVDQCVDDYDATTISIDYIELYLAGVIEVTFL